MVDLHPMTGPEQTRPTMESTPDSPSSRTDLANSILEHCQKTWSDVRHSNASVGEYVEVGAEAATAIAAAGLAALAGRSAVKALTHDLGAMPAAETRLLSLASDTRDLIPSNLASPHVGKVGTPESLLDAPFIPYASDTQAAAAWESVARDLDRPVPPGTIRVPEYTFDGTGKMVFTSHEYPADHPLAKVFTNHASSTVQILAMDDKGMRHAGSGFVLSEDGLIGTNNHVVQGATTFAIDVGLGAKLYAKPIARDADADIALLQVMGMPPDKVLQPVRRAMSSDVAEGSLVLGVGHPEGFKSPILSFGTNRGWIVAGNGNSWSGDLVIEMPTKPGSSGGPIFAEDGSVIAMTTGISPVGKATHAVPVEHLNLLVDQVNRRRPNDSWLDITSRPLDSTGMLSLSTPAVKLRDVNEYPDAELSARWLSSNAPKLPDRSRPEFLGPHHRIDFLLENRGLPD